MLTYKLIALDIGGVLALTNKTYYKNFNQDFFDNYFLLLQQGLIKPEQISIDKLLFKNMITAHANIRLLKSLKIPYVFASNINKIHWDKFIVEAKPCAYALKYSALSYELGCLKPEKLFFKLLAKKNNIALENIIFIDDREENIQAALSLGAQAILCQSPELLINILVSRKLINF